MKKSTLLLFLLLLTTGISAQDTILVENAKKRQFFPAWSTSRDILTNPGRHEISTNLIPAAVVLMGSSPDNYRFTLMYKKVSEDYLRAWRFGAGIYGTQQWLYNERYEQIERLTDSTRVINQFAINSGPSYRASFGYEWRRKGNRRLQTWTSLDVIAGIQFENYRLSNTYQKMDSLGNWRWDDDNNIIPFEYLDGRRSLFTQAGISVNAGLRYAINRYFLINFQTGIDVYANFGIDYQPDSMETLTGQQTILFDFHAPGLLNEVSLVFRF